MSRRDIPTKLETKLHCVVLCRSLVIQCAGSHTMPKGNKQVKLSSEGSVPWKERPSFPMTAGCCMCLLTQRGCVFVYAADSLQSRTYVAYGIPLRVPYLYVCLAMKRICLPVCYYFRLLRNP